MKSKNLKVFHFAIAASLITGMSCIFFSCNSEVKSPQKKIEAKSELSFVGGASCKDCHEAEYSDWKGSHHDLAMQEANESTVLGDFNTSFTYYNITSTFYKKDKQFFVRTDGPEGDLVDYPIKYTFGVYPLQQYLIEFPGGRLQVLNVNWDSRTKEEGGQRWFHLYPDEEITHRDVLHWTGKFQNWNFMCAECHSTDLQKNYNFDENTYNTVWSEIDVSCEACHGPGSLHVERAHQYEKDNKKFDNDFGLMIRLKDPEPFSWHLGQDMDIAERIPPLKSDVQVETCAACHSRRSKITSSTLPSENFLDAYHPSLLQGGLYHANGLIDDEVYVWGSFRQSKMYHSGVRCSDCHNPHSLELKQPGDKVCLDCHRSSTYDDESHHFHKLDQGGSSCIECHMPPKVYMGVDARHDHSFYIPRPDLDLETGSPNSCTICHNDKSAEWAATEFLKWYGEKDEDEVHFSTAFHRARTGDPRAKSELQKMIEDLDTPSILRATALFEYSQYLQPDSLEVLKKGLEDKDEIVRLGALQALRDLPAGLKVELASSLLLDPILLIRAETVRTFADVSEDTFDAGMRKKFNDAEQEFFNSKRETVDGPSTLLDLGVYKQQKGDLGSAEKYYKKSMAISPSYLPAYLNYADLMRIRNNEYEVVRILKEGISNSTFETDTADLHYSLGLSFIRQNRYSKALAEIKKASELRPDFPRYQYTYAVALNSTGSPNEALKVLKSSHEKFPNHLEILVFLVTLNRDMDQNEEALKYLEKIEALSPEDPSIESFRQNLLKK